MKRILSVSLGASQRDHEVEVELFGETMHLRRIGTDGDFRKAIALLEEADGNVDAIGLGGVDVYLYAGRQRFPLRDGVRLMEAVKKTPVVDGSGLKNSLEYDVVGYLDTHGFPMRGKKVLMVSALDRYGMAKAFADHGAELVCGDFIFALGVDRPIRSLQSLETEAVKLLPELGKLPIGFLYPIGKSQQEASKRQGPFSRYYHEADIIAGDFHFIRKHLPAGLPGKMIVTNTVTPEDLEMFQACGIATLVATTPEFKGRSFGTNVLEAALLAHLGKSWEAVAPDDYRRLLGDMNFKPRIESLNSVNNLTRMV